MTERKPYRVPTAGMEYNELVGSLGPYGNDNPIDTELRVRYGVRGGRYYDWTIELIGREGDVDSFRATGEHPSRLVMESFAIEDGAVVHRVRTGPGPDEFDTEVVSSLYSGDGEKVDSGYSHFLTQLQNDWVERHETVDPHSLATFGLARHDRDPQFRDGTYSWVRNTIACIDDDLVEDVVGERLAHYFPDGGTAAVHMRSQTRMKFIKAGPGSLADTAGEAGGEESVTATGDVTMGMMVEAIYRGDDWMDDLSI